MRIPDEVCLELFFDSILIIEFSCMFRDEMCCFFLSRIEYQLSKQTKNRRIIQPICRYSVPR